MARTIQTNKKAAAPATKSGNAKKATGDASAAGGIKKAHRFRPGTRAKMEIRQQQKSGVGCAIPRIAVERLTREILQDASNGTVERITHGALSAIHQALEDEAATLMLAMRVAAEPKPTIQLAHLAKVKRLRAIDRAHADPVALERARTIRVAGLEHRERRYNHRADAGAAAPGAAAGTVSPAPAADRM